MKVVFDTETGGLTPGWHEVIEIAIIPLDDRYYPDENIPMFHTQVRPEFPERMQLGALIANGRVPKDAEDKEAAMAQAMEKIMQYPERKTTILAFGEWYANYIKEKMAWLAHNGSFDVPMLEHWFMPSHKEGVGFRNFLNYQGRDTQRIAMFLQDRAKANNMPMPFKGVSLTKLAEHFGVAHEHAHTAVGDALATAAVYRKLCKID